MNNNSTYLNGFISSVILLVTCSGDETWARVTKKGNIF